MNINAFQSEDKFIKYIFLVFKKNEQPSKIYNIFFIEKNLRKKKIFFKK